MLIFKQLPKPVRAGIIGLGIIGGLLLIYQIPFIEQKLSWRLDELRTRVKYLLSPPEEALFLPEEQHQLETIVQATFEALTPTITATMDPTNVPATPVPTPSPTPLPESVTLAGVKYEDQHNRWNYCGPANLSMALTFWDWSGNRDDVGLYVKPGDKDKNVLPLEMVDFVDTQTNGLGILLRNGGGIQVLKQLLNAGFPVLVEKGYYEIDYTGTLGWLGHYQFVTGYDDIEGVLIVQDTYIPDGKDHRTSYEEFLTGWQSFNYLFMVVYPIDSYDQLSAALGTWSDPVWANQHALQLAIGETQTNTDLDEFFAWFNKGSSHVALQEYVDAAYAYDYAFMLYANLGQEEVMRPYRIMWYATGPYWAYYYSGRYQDVINLANTTLFETISEPVLEESFYWRGWAREAQGDLYGAISDWKTALELHPDWDPARYQLERVGELP